MSEKAIKKKKYICGFGRIICPKCEENGTLYCYFIDGHCGPYWHVVHPEEKELHKVKLGPGRYLFERKRVHHKTCYLGKLSDQELDDILKMRPWPLSSSQALDMIKKA
jgi:hypothetical protein